MDQYESIEVVRELWKCVRELWKCIKGLLAIAGHIFSIASVTLMVFWAWNLVDVIWLGF